MIATLDIDDDVMEAAWIIAKRERKPLDKVISGLARLGAASQTAQPQESPEGTDGVPFPVFPKQGGVVTLEHVRRLMDEEGI